jgi:hypothetical protein
VRARVRVEKAWERGSDISPSSGEILERRQPEEGGSDQLCQFMVESGMRRTHELAKAQLGIFGLDAIFGFFFSKVVRGTWMARLGFA